jgi:integrase
MRVSGPRPDAGISTVLYIACWENQRGNSGLERVNQALAQEPDWRWRAYFPFALMLGILHTELLSVRWADIDLNQRTLRLRETKAGRLRYLPLPVLAITLATSAA